MENLKFDHHQMISDIKSNGRKTALLECGTKVNITRHVRLTNGTVKTVPIKHSKYLPRDWYVNLGHMEPGILLLSFLRPIGENGEPADKEFMREMIIKETYRGDPIIQISLQPLN